MRRGRARRASSVFLISPVPDINQAAPDSCFFFRNVRRRHERAADSRCCPHNIAGPRGFVRQTHKAALVRLPSPRRASSLVCSLHGFVFPYASGMLSSRPRREGQQRELRASVRRRVAAGSSSTHAAVDQRLVTPPSTPRKHGCDHSPESAPHSRSHHGSPEAPVPSPQRSSPTLRPRRERPASLAAVVKAQKPLPKVACPWCWMAPPVDHHPEACSEKQKPDRSGSVIGVSTRRSCASLTQAIHLLCVCLIVRTCLATCSGLSCRV